MQNRLWNFQSSIAKSIQSKIIAYDEYDDNVNYDCVDIDLIELAPGSVLQ